MMRWICARRHYGTALVAAAVLCTLPPPTIAIERFVGVAVFPIVWDQIPVLVDSCASMVVRAQGLDFGRLRAWGSIGVVISTAAGWTIMATRPPLALLYVVQCSKGSSATGLLLAPMIMISHLAASAQGLDAVLIWAVLVLVTAGSGYIWTVGPSRIHLTMMAVALFSLPLLTGRWMRLQAERASRDRRV